jgi:drug/metabolite transporter (DMT)-like permease
MIPPRLAAFIAVVFWGISFVATKGALREVSPVTLIFIRFSVGAAMLLVVARGFPPRRYWPALALMGFIGIFVHQMLQAHALTMTSAVHTGWLIGLTPIWSAVLSAILLRERFGPLKLAGLIGGFAGALLVITRGEISVQVLMLPSTKGDFLILLSTINWAIYSVVGHPTIRAVGPTRATAGAMTFGLAMIAPFFIANAGWRELPGISVTGWLAILFLGIGCSGLGYLFWYGALERIEVSRVAAFLYVEPLVTLATAVALLHETVTVTSVVGGLLVIASVLVMQWSPKKNLKSTMETSNEVC